MEDLQSSFQTNQLLDLWEELKKAGDPVSLLENRTHTCPDHEGEKMQLYCSNKACQRLICTQCTVRTHHGHSYNLVGEVIDAHKKEIGDSIELLEEKLGKVKAALGSSDMRQKEISDQKKAIATDVNDTFQRFHDILDARKQELLEKLDQTSDWKLKTLSLQEERMEFAHQKLISCSEFAIKTLNEGNDGEIIKMRPIIVEQAKDLITDFQHDMLTIRTEADIEFFISDVNLSSQCQSSGEIYAVREPDPTRCYSTEEKTLTAVVGEASNLVMEAHNCKGQACVDQVESLQCELVSDITGASREIETVRIDKNKYQVNYRPTIKGKHKLHIKVLDQHIRGSPFAVTAKLPVEQLGTPVTTFQGFQKPWGLACLEQQLVVTQDNGGCMSILSSLGERVGALGVDLVDVNSPRGLAVDKEGNILVLDSSNNHILIFSPCGRGKLIRSQTLPYQSPFDVAVNTKNNNIYISGRDNHILVLKPDLLPSFKFGIGVVNAPCGIACSDATGKVYVADTLNRRVAVFTDQGKLLYHFVHPGQDNKNVYQPTCIAIDTDDRVYVTYVNQQCVAVFTAEGRPIVSFDINGDNQASPFGIAVDSDGVVYICDYANGCIHLF